MKKLLLNRHYLLMLFYLSFSLVAFSSEPEKTDNKDQIDFECEWDMEPRTILSPVSISYSEDYLFCRGTSEQALFFVKIYNGNKLLFDNILIDGKSNVPVYVGDYNISNITVELSNL